MSSRANRETYRVFLRRTNMTPLDNMVRFGPPELFDDPTNSVKVSCVFTWDKPRAEWLAEQWASRFADVELGGPAYGDRGDEFTPNMFIGQGAVITSRGCPKQCDFCLVPKREGYIRELDVKEGWNVLDNNLLACSEPHLDKVFSMLRKQKEPITFSGGLDASLLRQDHVDRLLSTRISQIFFAADTKYSEDILFEANKLLVDFSINKKRCYVLFQPKKETLLQAYRRARRVLKMGFLPFAQIYRGEDDDIPPSKEWKKLVRFWSKPAIFRQLIKDKK